MLSRVSTGDGHDQVAAIHDLSRQDIAHREVVFGRNADSDICLNTDSLPLLISRKHATISFVGHSLYIQDTGSTNGTYVNEQRLQPLQPKELHEGNVVSFGGPKLIIRDTQEHSNPFVYKVSAILSLLSLVISARTARRAARVDAAAVPSGEQAVDLTHTTSLLAAPSDVVDLTNSPDTQVCKQGKS